MAPDRIAFVTGANKGIGLAIVRQLALRYPSSALAADTSSKPGSFLIYLTSRDQSRGLAAMDLLKSDPVLAKAKALSVHGGPSEIRWRQLDINDPTSISAFAAFVAIEHGAHSVDVAVNNAGIALDGFDREIVDATLKTNYFMTLKATREWLPLMRNVASSRIVNVASSVGRLDFYSEALRRRFRIARDLESGGVDQVDGLMQEFADKVARDEHEKAGWPSKAYAVSKAGAIAFTGALAREERAKGFKGLINCCCPGWVVTDLTKQRGFKNPDQGAETPVKLSLDDIGTVTGEFWKDENVMKW